MINLNIIERPILYNPILIEGLPGIGNVGKMAVEYLIEKLNAKKFAEMYSDHFPYHVFINDDSTIQLPKNEFYYVKSKKHDLVLLTGDFQSMVPQGHYEISESILDFVKKLEVKRMITIGGFGVEGIPSKPKVIGAATDTDIISEFKTLGVLFEPGDRVGMIVGASGLLLGLGKRRGMSGVCLMGETFARPMFTDARASKAVLSILKSYLGIELDMADMDEKAKELNKAISKAKELEKQMVDKMKVGSGDELRYIG
ncbi:MAG: proteasome assembly chaperone family protein [Candidatus Altiarchaeota archaeon]|nr:proteasome assembly chaperone family protein [Candidatus Altiarchaeota archaeon]